MIHVQILIAGLHRGHLGSTDVTNRFLLITNSEKVLQINVGVDLIVSVYHELLFKTHRLICTMTYLGQQVTSRDLDLRSNIDLTVQDHHVYVSARLDERNTMVFEFGR